MKLPHGVLTFATVALLGIAGASWSAPPPGESGQSQIQSERRTEQQNLLLNPDMQGIKPAPPSAPYSNERPRSRVKPRAATRAGAAATPDIRLRIAQSIDRKDWNGVTTLARQHPGQFGCDQIAFLWGLAEAHHALGSTGEAVAVYQSIIPSCPRAADRIATLQKASAILGAETFADLLQREAQGGQRDAVQQARFDQVTYEYHVRRFLQAVEAKDPARASGLIGTFEAGLRARRDARNATLAGWVYFDAGQPETAATWFATALAWEPGLEDARYGLALANFRLSRLDDAEAALRQANADDPRTRALQGDIALARAMKAYEGKDYQRSLEYLSKADVQGRSGDSARDIAMLRAWNTYQLGDYPEAARLFTGLYRDQPDSPSAEGVVFSLARSERWDELAQLARSLGGPLEDKWKTTLAQRYYDRKLFLAAEAAAPGRIVQLHNIAAASIALGAAVRDKAGDDGTTKFRLTQAPFVEGVTTFGDRTHELRLQLSRITLNSGNLPANAMIGSFPVAGGYVTTPTTRLANGIEPHLSYRHQGWLTTYAGIGLTPSDAVVSSAPVGNLGVMQQFERGNWRAEIFSQPVRESILSYTGIVDPYTGQSWGRVRRHGALVDGYTALTERWSGSARLQATHLEGRDVASNQGIALNLGLATDLKTKLGLRDFDYFSVGPDLSYEAYRKNLSHFTLGHGGYFSPEHLVSLGASAHFLTSEARRHIIKGDFSAGVFDKREAASPCFPGGSPLPVNPACGYAGTSDRGFYYSAQLMGVLHLSDNLQLGGALVVRSSPQYDDKAVMVFLRFVLDPRKVVMSSDLPEGLLQRLY